MRPVPHLIDSNSRLGEYLMVFMIPLFLLRTIDPFAGLITGAVLCTIYIQVTIGKSEGYLIHSLYRMGLPLSGLLDVRVKRLIS